MNSPEQASMVDNANDKEYLKLLDPSFSYRDVCDFNEHSYKPDDKAASVKISDIIRRHRAFTDAAGIRLVSHIVETPFNYGSGPESYVKLHYKIEDGARIAKYLDAQAEILRSAITGKPEAVDDIPLSDRTLSVLGLLENVRYELEKLPDLEDEDDYVLSLAVNVKHILKSFEPIVAFADEDHPEPIKDFLFKSGIKDIADIIERLRPYNEHIQNGDFKEYLLARQLFLERPFMASDREFVLRWHKDTTPTRLNESWESVVRTLRKIKENKNAGMLFAQALKTAEDALDFAIDDITAWGPAGDNKYKAMYRDDFLGILTKTKAKLSRI